MPSTVRQPGSLAARCLILVILGATGLGSTVKFIPQPVVVGFTNGIAVVIASTQIRDFLGLDIPHAAGEFVPRMKQVFAALPSFSLPAAAPQGRGAAGHER